jgi:hypothetical protein
MTQTMKFVIIGSTSFVIVLAGLFVPGNPMRERIITKEDAYSMCLTADENQLLSETELRTECYEEYTRY